MLKTDPCSTRTTTAAKDLEEKVGYGRTQGRKLEIFCGCGFGNRFGEIGVTMALAGDTRNGRMPSFAVEQGAGQGDGYCRQKKMPVASILFA